jgi:hypothetical protein
MSSSSGSVGCLLPAENLRCIPLNLVQIQALAIAPVIELFFCVFYIYMTWKSSRAHLLLAADGVLYFILALVDLLSHVIPAARNSVTTSRMAELFLGSVSFVPMLSYTSYLLWLSRRDFIPYLPRRLQPAAKYFFTGFIPVLVVSDFVASLGISIQNLSFPQAPLMIDFTNKSESLWLSLGQLSLALYSNYQCLTAFLALYRLFAALSDQRRIDITDTDERHFFNGTGWIAFGIKVGAVETIVGFAGGGFAVPLSRRILRLMGRVCIIIGSLKGMDENENFEFLNKELVLWRRGKPLSTSHSLIANRRMGIRSSQVSDLNRESSAIEKDVERGEADRGVTIHDEVDEPQILSIRFSALPPPERAFHADESRGQSGQNTSTEVLVPRTNASPSKSNTRRQSVQTTLDLEPTPDLPPGITGVDQQNMHRTQSYGKEDAATECAVFNASKSMDHKPILPHISIPQSAHARVEGSVLPWIRLTSQQRGGNYPVQFPVTPTRAGITIYSPTGQLEGEGWDSPKHRQGQLSSLHLLERASKARSDVTAHSSQWSTIACSQSSASIRMYGGGPVISPRRASANPGDLVYPSSAETLRDGKPQIIVDRESDTAIHEFEIQAAFNREKALRRLNGEVGV